MTAPTPQPGNHIEYGFEQRTARREWKNMDPDRPFYPISLTEAQDRLRTIQKIGWSMYPQPDTRIVYRETGPTLPLLPVEEP